MPLEAVNLGFRYNGGPWIIRDFSFAVEPGEIVGLFGPSGSGKSTLARILANYEKPREGRVFLDGITLPDRGYNPVQLVLQHPEKAVNPRWQLGKTITEGWIPDQGTLAAFGISRQWYDRWPHELSAGELQRFCVIRALGPETRYLVADEMTTMLDAVTQAQIWQAVVAITARRKLGLVMISHEKILLGRFCRRIIEVGR